METRLCVGDSAHSVLLEHLELWACAGDAVPPPARAHLHDTAAAAAAAAHMGSTRRAQIQRESARLDLGSFSGAGKLNLRFSSRGQARSTLRRLLAAGRVPSVLQGALDSKAASLHLAVFAGGAWWALM